jgi:hypothetical protein
VPSISLAVYLVGQEKVSGDHVGWGLSPDKSKRKTSVSLISSKFKF